MGLSVALRCGTLLAMVLVSGMGLGMKGSKQMTTLEIVTMGDIREGMRQEAWDFVAYAAVQMLRQDRSCEFARDALRYARQMRKVVRDA